MTADLARGDVRIGASTLAALIAIVGPLAGGMLLQRFGPVLDCGFASLLCRLSAAPIPAMAPIDAGPVPRLAETLRGIDRGGMLAFAPDGWMSSGLALAWLVPP